LRFFHISYLLSTNFLMIKLFSQLANFAQNLIHRVVILLGLHIKQFSKLLIINSFDSLCEMFRGNVHCALVMENFSLVLPEICRIDFSFTNQLHFHFVIYISREVEI
jgi:hypothetical protein